eukprot:gene12689-biopygen7602
MIYTDPHDVTPAPRHGALSTPRSPHGTAAAMMAGSSAPSNTGTHTWRSLAGYDAVLDVNTMRYRISIRCRAGHQYDAVLDINTVP